MLDAFAQFRCPPTSFQFALGGAWENAWSFPVDRVPSHEDLVTYLGQATEVAFEAFFGNAFFGARMTGSPLAVETFGVQCLRAARAQESFFSTFHRELGCPVRGQRPAFAEIGCVNAWRSVGALHVPDLHRASVDFEPLWLSLQGSSVGRDTHHAKAVEFAFEHPLAHWFGVPVSTPGGPHHVCEDLLRHALGRLAPL